MIAGAIASSAPVQPELNFEEYFEVVELSLLLQVAQASLTTSKRGEECPNAILTANIKLDSMLNDPSQLSTVESKFK